MVVLEPVILQPALKAIVLALLPGLEEEASEEFERTHALLNRFRSAMGQGDAKEGSTSGVASDRFFWQSLFLATITSPSRRQGALAYLVRNLPLLGPLSQSGMQPGISNVASNGVAGSQQLPPYIEAVASPEPGLLIRCFAAGLQDEQLLVQRGFLDLLVTHLPLDSPILQQRVAKQDLELLVGAAVSVVARREMSLNRRLWVWFLSDTSSSDAEASEANSPESGRSPTPRKINKDSPIKYFETYGLKPLIDGLLKAFAMKNPSPSAHAKPFRICLSLMDRWEIGGLVVPRIFRQAMESIYLYREEAPSTEAFLEVSRSANVFFDGIQSQLIWREIILLLSGCLATQNIKRQEHHLGGAQRQIELVWFVLTTFNTGEEEMLAIHLPNTLIYVLISLRELAADDGLPWTPYVSEVVQSATKIASYLIDQVPIRLLNANVGHQELLQSPETASRVDKSILSSIVAYYGKSDRLQGDQQAPIQGQDILTRVLRIAESLVLYSMNDANQTFHLDSRISILTKVVIKSPKPQALKLGGLLSALELASAAPSLESPAQLSKLLGQAAAMEIVSRTLAMSDWQSDYRVRNILTAMIVSLWDFVSYESPKHNVEAIRCLWRIHHVSPDRQLVEATVTNLLQRAENRSLGPHITLHAANKFAVLWNHSITIGGPSPKQRPQMIRSDSIMDIRSERSTYSAEILARPLLLLIESLSGSPTELSMFTSDWLQSMPHIHV